MSSSEPIELEPVGGARSFLDELESALAGDIDAAQLHRSLEASRDVFLHLLSFKPNNPSSRAIVESGTVHTTEGVIALDKVPDIQEITLLADELHLDELTALSLVLSAQVQSGIVSAAAAAGILYSERVCAAQSLLTLLHAQVACSETLPPSIYATIANFNASLLHQEEDPINCGKTVLIQRLVTLIQASSVASPPPSSRLAVVLDSYGRELDAADSFIHRECTTLCQCLFYACCIKQRLSAADVEPMLDLLHHMALHARTPSLSARHHSTARHQSNLVLLSVLLPMLPLEDVQGEAMSADDQALRQLAQHAGVDAKIRSGAKQGDHDDGCAAVVRLAWGLLPLCCDEQSLTKRALGDVKAALNGGALGYLGSAVMSSHAMKDEDEDVRLTAASVVHQLLTLFLEVASEGMALLRETTLKGAAAELEADTINTTTTTTTTTAMDADVGGGHPHPSSSSAMVLATTTTTTSTTTSAAQETYHPRPDTLATYLNSLAAAFSVHPALFLEEERRVEHVGVCMSEIGHDPALANIPSIFLGYLAVLTALAKTEAGARNMFAQLRGDNAPTLVSWRRMFDTLQTIVRRYNPGEGQEQGGGGRTSELILSANDTKALCAFSRLFETVMSEGNADEVVSWSRQLDDEAGVAPSWEVLFQVMCCPVPQALKAALDGAIAALARRSDLAAALWERLMAAVVVQQSMPGFGGSSRITTTTTTTTSTITNANGSAAVPRYDLVYQLNEIESRDEDYQEALAFVQLLNVLWRAGPLSDEGRSVAHLTRFVVDDLLGTVFQRAFKDESQRWCLVAAGLDHCRLCLEALTSPPSLLAAEVAASLSSSSSSSSGVQRAPGMEVLLDLLCEKSAARAALTTLSLGVDRLAGERHATAAGAAKENAALAALRLLHSVFLRDAAFVEASRRSLQHSSAYETFDSVLRHDRARIPALFEYVRYPFNRKVQEEALRLARDIAERTPHLVQLLTLPTNHYYANGGGGDSNTTISIVHRLQDSFAACMHDAVSTPPSTGENTSSSSNNAEDEDDEDHRPSLIIELLLTSLEAPTPNLTQLLCGYWIDGGTLPLVFHEAAAAMHTPLRVILDLVGQSRNALLRPLVFEQCLELLYELADRFETGPATLELLRSYHGVLVPLLDTVACAPLPPPGPGRAASLHQRAWLLQLFALELHRADPVISLEQESLQMVLQALFGQEEGPSGVLSRGRLIDVLALAVSHVPAEPQLLSSSSSSGGSVSTIENQNNVRRMMQALDIEALLASPAAPGEGGLHITGPRGDPMLDVTALKDELLRRYGEWVTRHGAPGEALKEAGRAALTYASEFNTYAEEMGGRAALLEAWQTVVSVAFSRRFDILSGLMHSAGAATDLVVAATEHTLEATAAVLQGPAAGLAPPLCNALEALFARLQEQAITAATVDLLTGLPLPSRCHGLFSALCSVLWEGRSQEAVRLVLYNAVVSYLAMCRGPTVMQAPPSVVAVLLQGVGRGGAEQIDAVNLQLEEGNVAVAHANARLLHLLAQDAVSPNATLSTAALTALSSLISADPTTALADELHRIALPARLLQDIQDQSPEILVQPPPAGQAATLVVEAKLALLLRLALAGPPSHRASSAQKLFSLQALPRLAACRAIDLQPEEPGFASSSTSSDNGGGGTSLRHRLHLIIMPALRLVLALVTSLPHSAAVHDQTAAFVEAHGRALARVLRDSASSGVRGWEPSDAELEESTLTVQLMNAVTAHHSHTQVAPPLQEAIYRTASRFLASNTRSQSPAVVKVAAARDAGTATAAQHRTYAKIVALRCAVASYLRAMSASSTAAPILFPCAPLSSGSGDLAAITPTLFLIKDALLQAAVHDLPDALADQSALMAVLEKGGAVLTSASLYRREESNHINDDDAAAETRAAVVRAASLRHTEVVRLGTLIEHLLAILFQHLKVVGVGASGRGGGISALRPSNSAYPPSPSSVMKAQGNQLGSVKDLDQLRRLTEPAIAALEGLLGAGSLPGDTASFELLIRRTKERLAAV